MHVLRFTQMSVKWDQWGFRRFLKHFKPFWTKVRLETKFFLARTHLVGQNEMPGLSYRTAMLENVVFRTERSIYGIILRVGYSAFRTACTSKNSKVVMHYVVVIER